MIDTLQMEVDIFCKLSSNRIKIKKVHLLLVEIIVVIKVLRVKYAPFTGKDKGIVMAHNSRCLLVRHANHY